MSRYLIPLVILASAAVEAQQPTLMASPTRPAPGSLVRLTLEAAGSGADSVLAVDGYMSGEPLHFARGQGTTWRAIGPVSVDATDSVPARVAIHRASGDVDSVAVFVTLPKRPPPAKPGRPRVLAVNPRFTRPMSAETQARIAREKEMAREVGLWRTSFRDASQALDLARRLQTDTPLFIGDLGVYQLILNLSDQDKLADFTQTTLGSLLEYDQRQNADLIKTLEAFFNCHGNLSQTAEQLIVHRNTLLYRMNRINEIASIDLDRPETRLAMHLALTIRRLLGLGG